MIIILHVVIIIKSCFTLYNAHVALMDDYYVYLTLHELLLSPQVTCTVSRHKSETSLRLVSFNAASMHSFHASKLLHGMCLQLYINFVHVCASGGIHVSFTLISIYSPDKQIYIGIVGTTLCKSFDCWCIIFSV